MAFSITVTCPGCGDKIPLTEGRIDWLEIDNVRYHSEVCAATNAFMKSDRSIPIQVEDR